MRVNRLPGGCSIARAAMLVSATVMALCAQTVAAVPPYTLVGTFSLPAGTQVFDVLADGRVIAIRGGDIFEQGVVHMSVFTRAGGVSPNIFDGPFGNFGAGFLRRSPDGSTLAIGDNGAQGLIHFVSRAALDPAPGSQTPTQSLSVPNYEAHWAADGRLFVTGATAESILSEVDHAAMTSRVIVTNIGGASAGVVTDGTHLYAGNGFDFVSGGSQTGDIRAFALSALGSRAVPADFESEGVLVARSLSANSLGFDAGGNLLVGGGDFTSGDQGYAAVIDGARIAAALGLGPAAIGADLELAPAGEQFYATRWNGATGELLVSYFGSDSVFRYAIPAPPAGLAIAAMLGIVGIRRRR